VLLMDIKSLEVHSLDKVSRKASYESESNLQQKPMLHPLGLQE